MRSAFCFLICLIVVSACSPKAIVKRDIARLENELKEHTGFMLYDPVKEKELIEHQSGRYFTPASNTKIFTFYASLKILKDSLAAIRYVQRGDSLIFWGLGDRNFKMEAMKSLYLPNS